MTTDPPRPVPDRDGGVSLSREEAVATSPGKRKREDDLTAPTKPTAKRKKSKRKVEDDGDLDLEAGINKAFALMDGRLLADQLGQRLRRFEPDLSMVELNDQYISGRVIKDTTAWQKPRGLDNLPDFLEQYSPKGKLSISAKEKGCPHTIVVAGAGLRAADLTRALRRFQTKEAMVAKLFAKHIKLKEAEQFVKSTRLERLVVDASHIDVKKRGILDMRETCLPLLKLLNRPALQERLAATEKPIDLLFY
ncbi:MAG: hypothetical protein M1817_001401 [Caeruleum heppii]|nr:MAG: hypothetical protein M1817_001401 [Caeruleum heppii]